MKKRHLQQQLVFSVGNLIYIGQCSILHDPYEWQGNLFVRFKHRKQLKTPHQRDCNGSSAAYITVVDMSARQHNIEVFSCEHQSIARVLVQSGLWPATPTQPRSAMDFSFLQLYNSMLLEGQLPKNAFCRGMGHFKRQQSNSPDHVDVYRMLCGESGQQYMRFCNMVHKLSLICDDHILDDSKCPICATTPNIPKVFSLDGNFRLVRRKNAGESPYQPYHMDSFFIVGENEEAGNHEDVHVQECNNFKAGIVVSRHNKHLDITGLFGSVCVHDFPRYFINMRAGESLSLPASIVKKLRSDFDGKINILYDIACRFKPFLENKIGVLGRAHKPKTSRTKKPTKDPRGPTAMSLFAKSFTPENKFEYLKEMQAVWKTKPGEEKKQLAAEAKVLRSRTDDQLTAQEQTKLVEGFLAQMDTMMKRLEKLGGDGFFVIMYKGQILTGGSEKATNFIEKENQLLPRLYAHLEGSQATTTGKEQLNHPAKRRKLVSDVRKMMNEKYCEFTGKKIKFPYADYVTGKVKFNVSGLPENLSIKNLSHMGISSLHSLLENKDSINLTRVSQGLDDGQDTAVGLIKSATLTNEDNEEEDDTVVALQNVTPINEVRENIKKKLKNRKPTAKKKRTKGSFSSAKKKMKTSEDEWRCTVCKFVFGDENDPKITEAWYPCNGCFNKFHQSCAEGVGILEDDNTFICKNCV